MTEPPGGKGLAGVASDVWDRAGVRSCFDIGAVPLEGTPGTGVWLGIIAEQAW